MSQLLSGKQKGRFGAPPEPRTTRSPWSYIPIYLLLPITVIVLVIAAVPTGTYLVCRNMDAAMCISVRLNDVEDGSYLGVGSFVGALLLVSFVLAILSAVRMRKWPVALCWGLAVVGLGLAVVALLMVNGSLPTPFGTLVRPGT